MTNFNFLKVVLPFIALILNFNTQAQTSVIDTISSIKLDEVVINASKNDLKIKELPAAVSVINISTLENENVETMSDLTSLTANFYMPDYGSKLTSPIYIRGIGSRINAPSVGLYVDHVPYFEKSAFQFDFFDVQKVEILRGPQGTLYGRNTMGGIINILTLSPDTYQGTKVKLSAGDYGRYTLNASYYTKLNDQWSSSLSGNYIQDIGNFTNEYSNTLVDKMQSIGLRHRLKYKPSSNFDIENIASVENSEQGGYPYAIYNVDTNTTSPINYDQYSSYDRTLFSDALHMNYKGNGWRLTNTTSFQLLDDKQGIDQDFTPIKSYFITQLQDQKTISNELLVQSSNTDRYSWLFGVFGFYQNFDNSVDVNYYPADMWYLKTYDKSIGGASIFHQSILKITDNLSAIAGIRYDIERSKLHYLYEGTRGSSILPSQDTIYPSLKEGVPSGKLALNYKYDNSSVYASFTTGYKPGGYNTTFEKPEHLTFKYEDSFNYEIGFKTDMIDHVFSTDFSVFYTFLNDQQIYNTAPSGRGSYLSNAGKSRNKGFEWSLNLNEISGFRGNISYGFTHAKIIEYVKDETTNYNNMFTPYVPRSMFATQLSKTFDLSEFSAFDNATLSASYNRIGEQYWNLENTLKENPYNLVNAKFSLKVDNVQFSLWGKNLFNDSYHTFIFEALKRAYAQNNKPRTFGVDVSLNF